MATSHINTECKRYGCIKNLLACYANCRYSTRCDELKNEILDKTEQAAKDINLYLGERGSPPITIQHLKRGLKFTEAARVKPPPASDKKLNREASPLPTEAPPSPSAGHAASSKKPMEKLKPKTSRLKMKRRAARRPKAEPSGKNATSRAATERATVRLKRAQAPSLFKEAPRPVATRTAQGPPVSAGADAAVARQAHSGGDTKGERRRLKKRRPKIERRLTNVMPKISRSAPTTGKSKKEMSAGRSSGAQVMQANDIDKAKETVKSRRKKAPRKASPSSSERNGKLFIIMEGKSASLVDEKGLMLHLLNGASPEARYFEAREVEARVQIVQKA